MSEPRRLLDDGASDLESSLLRSARWDAPPAGSRGKALVALGIGSATAVAGSGATAGTIAAKAGTAALLKWIAGGVVAGVVMVGVGARLTQAPDDARPIVTVASVPTGNPVGVPPIPPVVVVTAPTSPVSAVPEPTAAPQVSAPPRAPTLADEVASLDAARQALASGDAGRALRAVDDHDRRFPGGALGPEATVVRIEALALRGDRATATRMATAFLASHPSSPHASRLRTLLGLPADGATKRSNGP